ncbi:MAG: hypothetical protein Q4F13_05570 [Pseudomonadota bacterium]|nr:hypothetical protein [Pseudomonadota bacterium]
MPTLDDEDRPFAPPEMDTGAGALRWVVGGVASVLLIVGAWRAYEWLVADVERRRTAAEQAPTMQATPEAPADALLAPPAPTSPSPPAPAPPPTASRRAQPPVVAGAAGVNKCVSNGRVTYTNAPCPENDAEPAPLTDLGAATPDAAAGAPPSPAPLVLSANSPASARHAACNHLLAEIARLDFEFQQPLPPPVLDHISTHLGVLRSQHAEAQCPPLPKSLAQQVPRTQAPVVDEKNGH